MEAHTYARTLYGHIQTHYAHNVSILISRADWKRNLHQILETQYDLNYAVKYIYSNTVDVTCFPYRLLQDKTDQIINTILIA